MDASTTREKILKKIRAALLTKSPDPYPNLDHESQIFSHSDEDPVVVFSENFTSTGGKFFLCENELEFVEGLLNLTEQYKWTNIYCSDEGLSNLLTECEFPHLFEAKPSEFNIVITSCECLIARNGTIVISSKSSGYVLPVFAPVHVICARRSHIAMEMKDALHWLKLRYGKLPAGITFISGPSSVTKQQPASQVSMGSDQVYIFLVDDHDLGFIESAPEDLAGEQS